MSEKRSWDIQPKRKAAPPPPPAPIPQTRARVTRPIREEKPRRFLRASKLKPQRSARPAPVARPSSLSHTTRPQQVDTVLRVRKQVPPKQEKVRALQSHRRERVPQGKEREPLKARRRRARNRFLTLITLLTIFIVLGIFASIWLPAFRIQNVQTAGPESTQMQQLVFSDLSGTTRYIFPRNSIFFFPESRVRADILDRFPLLAAVSISRTSFDTISLTSVSRTAAFLWCGDTYPGAETDSINAESQDETADSSGSAAEGAQQISTSAQTNLPHYSLSNSQTSTSSAAQLARASSTQDALVTTPPPCYQADSQGYVFATDIPGDVPDDTLKVYGDVSASTTNPIGLYIAGAARIPNALQFVKAIRSLGVIVTTLALRGDEADIYAQSGTRITYVLGQEQQAASLAESAFPSLNLNDGSLEYVDLRFPGKVYFKKVGS